MKVKIKVVRAFFIGRESQHVGNVIEIDKPLAIELVALGKAEVVQSDPAKVDEIPDPVPTDDKSASKRGAKK